MTNFKVKKSTTMYSGRVFDVHLDEIEYDSSRPGTRDVVVHPGGAVIIALTKEYKIVLVSQYRYPLDKYILELPAGKLDRGEDPLECARRELKEETGYGAKSFEKIGTLCTAPGYSSEMLHFYLAEFLEEGDHKREEGELDMQMYAYSLKELDALIAEGTIFDAKTISGIYLAKMKLMGREHH